MEVTGPAPVGGNQPLQPIQAPETVAPGSEMAAADAVDRVELSPEAQAQVDAGAAVSGASSVGEVGAASTALPPLSVDRAHAQWLAEKSPSESAAILEGQRRFWMAQGYGESQVAAQVEAYEATLNEMRGS